jgi:hypothetical protein
MGNRSCPLCFVKVPRALVLSRSNDLECPACRVSLELSRPSRVRASVAGFAAGLFAGRYALHASGGASWTFPLLAAILSFGFCSALVLFFFSDLVVRPKATAATFPHPGS